MEPNNRPVRIPVIVDRLSRPNNLVCQRHEVPDGRRRSNILEVRSTLRRQTPLPELVQLGIRLRHTRIKLVEFLGVLELGRDCLVDGPHDSIIPKCKLFRKCVEANYVAGAERCQGRGKPPGEPRKGLNVIDHMDQARVVQIASLRSGTLLAWIWWIMGRKNSQCIGAGTARVPRNDIVLPSGALAELGSQERQEHNTRSSRSTYKAPI